MVFFFNYKKKISHLIKLQEMESHNLNVALENYFFLLVIHILGFFSETEKKSIYIPYIFGIFLIFRSFNYKYLMSCIEFLNAKK